MEQTSALLTTRIRPFGAVLTTMLLALSASWALAPGRAVADANRPNVDLARLSLTVTTSSGWTKLHLSSAGVRSSAVTNNPTAVDAVSTADGVALSHVPVTGATVTFSILLEELTGASSFTATIEKGSSGATTVKLVNTSATPYDVATLSDSTSGSANNAVSASLSRQQLFGSTEPALPHADPRHPVLAFYYPWYSKSSFSSGRTFDQPASGPYDSFDAPTVADMTAQARANGIDGFIVSWSGDARNGPQFDLALQSARATNGYVTGYLETLSANVAHDPSQPTDPSTVRLWLDQLLARSSDPAFLASGGVPVVFVYGMYRLSVDMWTQILTAESALGHPVRLVGDGGLPAYASVMWGSHLYSPNALSYDDLWAWDHGRLVAQRGAAAVNASVSPKLYAATVSPGFDNCNAKAALGEAGTYVDRGPNGDRYQLTWNAALATDPDWVLVTSWNEWYEGTVVQPGAATGTLSLSQTKANAAAF